MSMSVAKICPRCHRAKAVGDFCDPCRDELIRRGALPDHGPLEAFQPTLRIEKFMGPHGSDSLIWVRQQKSPKSA